MKPIIFDTETTGTDNEKDQIIEAAWLELPATPAEFSAVRAPTEFPHYLERFKPTVPISLGAQATHHIICEDLVGCRESSEFALPAGDLLMIGHNVDFDWRMAGEPKLPRVCTLALSRFLFPDKDSHTQSAMLYLIGRRFGREAWARDLLKNAHAALDDVRNCAILLRFLLQVAQEAGHAVGTWSEVYTLSEKARFPTVMPYGKHKGTPISQVPSDYKAWLLRQPDVDPYLEQALRAR
ncbi:hypothetical protein D9M68_760140 [compost metagenome]